MSEAGRQYVYEHMRKIEEYDGVDYLQGATGDIHCIVPRCKRGDIHVREEERCVPHVYRGQTNGHLRALIVPDKPSNKPYTELHVHVHVSEVAMKHLAPRKIVIAERFRSHRSEILGTAR